MLKHRILNTLRFFDLQDTPLTLFELHCFLMVDLGRIRPYLDEGWELRGSPAAEPAEKIPAGEILQCIESECAGEVENRKGYYALKGRAELAEKRLGNYLYGIKREKLIRRYAHAARHLPFLRGLGLVGSQALGQSKEDSDIDLLILVEPGFMWLARFFVTAYFQVLGKRRHGKKIRNRFCLNHYIALNKTLDADRNLYTASEYLKMRKLEFAGNLSSFQRGNRPWMAFFFPAAPALPDSGKPRQGRLQLALEKLFMNNFGRWLEKQAKKIQYRRLDIGEFIVATDSELSFHPENRKKTLFAGFFKFQKQD